ncbi:MAG: chromosome segregation protein SMC [Actinomycetota bacterium]|nr:chromosome segregation protein SMC [Actinomycetota bacterium]
MFLKSLTLKGFKSFADATTLQLEPGVTVVVGPNGSGKSNVVDAIAWVLGAQAPSAVRSQKMDDVIFAGTAKRPALGRAEVTLTLDNSAGLLPIEFTEVTVSRTLFRTGESEYAINGVNCRLLDVQELLSDAGVGRQQHVIVSQGQIDAVLNARPEDRRGIIEEAAGVLKYRRRKEKAERRLDATEASLLRVQDLLREVRRQLRPLERQADAARRHGDLVAELNALKIFLSGREIASQRLRLTALAGERITLATAEQELRTELAGLDIGVMAAEAELTARGDTDLSDEMVRVEQLRERARGIAAVLVERRRSMERDRGQLMDSGVVANLEGEAQRLRDELASVEADLAAVGPEAEALATEETTFADQRRDTMASIEGISAGTSAASAAAEVRGELRSMRAGLERAEAELRRQRARIDSLRQKGERLDGECERLRVECETAQAAEAALVGDVESAEARRIAAEAAHDSLVAARQEVAEEASRWKARAEALNQALEGARARAGAEHLAGVDGVLGTLLDLIEIDEGWESAVEAALGEALQAVVVASPDTGRRALQSLQASNVHGAVLALGARAGAPAAPTAGEPVRPHVRSRHDGVPALLDAVLAGAVRAQNWEAALDVALGNPTAVVVTSDGGRFGPTGWRVGAIGGGATAAALEEAQERSGAAATELALRDTALAGAKAELQAARQHEHDLTRKLDAHDAGFTANSEALARAQAERREAQAEIETVERGLGDAEERTERERARIAELESLVPALEADEAAEAEAAKARGEARARLDAQAAILNGRRKDLEVRNAGLHERQAFLERRLAETERRLEADAAARAEAGQRREAVERSLQAVEHLGALVDQHRHVVELRHMELLEIRRRQSDEVRAVAQRLEGLRRRRAAAEKELDENRERGRRVEIDEAEVRMRLEGAVEALRRDHDLEPDYAEAAEMPPLAEGVNPAAKVRDLERELRLMGPINPLALEEFTELQERHRFLDEQLEDVRNTRRDLMRVIKAVDLEIQTVFSSAFADVSTHFASLFSNLFPGGVGKLVLTTPDDLLNTGIEVEAKPSGKNVKKLSLLSGGERSLTALAFLFAVFRSRPSPFYVMDEVEAALDDVNLHRFLGLIHEFRQEAQLLIVSHQKRTMEAGDSLLGVTMQPGGSSKVIVERVSANT